MTAPPDVSLFDEDEMASLVAEYESRRGEGLSEAALLRQQQSRELRLLRARHGARLAFDEEQAVATDEDRASPLVWPEFLARDLSNVDWFAGKVMARGQQISLVGDGKAGKSLFSLEWAWRAATGLPFLGDIARPPVRVLYVDQENSHDDIQSRMVALGATADQLENLIYLSFPAFRALNTAGGGADLMRTLEKHRAELVFFDTISRMIEGKENDSDPWLDLYRYTLLPLKRAGGSSVRLDHFGKDKDRGSRGSSAKNQDVDHVWELLTFDSGPLMLRRTHTRTGIGPDSFSLHRLGEKDGDRWAAGTTRHVLAAADDVAAPGEKPVVGLVVQQLAAMLDKAGQPVTWGRPKTGQWLRENGQRHADSIIADVVRYRQENPI